MKVTIKSIPGQHVGDRNFAFAGQLVLPAESSLDWRDRIVSDIAIATVRGLGLQGWFVETRDRFYFGSQAGFDEFQKIVARTA